MLLKRRLGLVIRDGPGRELLLCGQPTAEQLLKLTVVVSSVAVDGSCGNVRASVGTSDTGNCRSSTVLNKADQ